VKRVLLRMVGVALLAGAAVWLVYSMQHVLSVIDHRGQVHVNEGAFLRPFLVALARALFPAGALFGCGLWAFEAARRARRREGPRWTGPRPG
jgi:hypothetical protein